MELLEPTIIRLKLKWEAETDPEKKKQIMAEIKQTIDDYFKETYGVDYKRQQAVLPLQKHK